MSTSDSDRFEELSSSSSQSAIPESNQSNLPTISISKPENETDEEKDDDDEGSLIFHDTVPDAIEHLIASIEKLKTDGNLHFSKRNWQNALNMYNEALLELPPISKIPSVLEGSEQKTVPSVETEGFSDDSNDWINGGAQEPKQGPSKESKLESQTGPESSTLDPRLCNLRATLNANSAACHLKLIGSLPWRHLQLLYEMIQRTKRLYIDEHKGMRSWIRGRLYNLHWMISIH